MYSKDCDKLFSQQKRHALTVTSNVPMEGAFLSGGVVMNMTTAKMVSNLMKLDVVSLMFYLYLLKTPCKTLE